MNLCKIRRRALLLAICAGLASASAARAADRPNVVFLLVDDLGWRDVGCYGSPFCETPNIDRLAAQGVRFTQAYTAGSVCSPTRSSIMTGKYPVRTGVTDYIPGLRPPGMKLLTKPTAQQLALEEVTIGEAFREQGYQTFYAGKWHLGGAGFEPTDQGFDVYEGGAQLGNHGRDPLVGQRISQAAVRFLDERDAGRPCFLFLGYHEPHTPILEYPNHLKRFQDKAAQLPPAGDPVPEHDGLTRPRQDDPAYGSEVAGLDEWVGIVLDAIDQRKLRDDTIVVFFSDNGGLSVLKQPGPTSNSPLRAGKGWLYEGGIRVPLIIRAPGLPQPGRINSTPVISTDLYPTLLELAGLPLKPAQHLDGASLAGLLRGDSPLRPRTLYWHYPHYHGSTWAPGAALRDGDWKLIELQHYGNVELYNLRDDLGERRDLSAKMPDKTAELLARLRAWRKETGAAIPQPNPDAGVAEPSKNRQRQPR
jgi:arylsulfatase A-like enzyme